MRKIGRLVISILFAMACLSMCLLWIRSYWLRDNVSRTSATTIVGGSSNAGMISTFMSQAIHPYSAPPARPMSRHGVHKPHRHNRFYHPKLLEINWRDYNKELTAPHWLIAIFLATFAALPWIPPRFSLRWLFLAMTALGGLLAITAWAAR